MGNPNVGKSMVFSRLTDVQVMTSNYPGTTVEYAKGHMLIGNEKCEVIDVPGTYTLNPTCKAEEVACEMLKKAEIKGGEIIVVPAKGKEESSKKAIQQLEK